MKALKIASFILGILILTVVSGVVYLGGFSSVQVSKTTIGPMNIVYSVHRGSYQTIGQSWVALQKSTEEAGLTSCDGLAIYLDPPETPPENLRSILACDLSEVDDAIKDKLTEKFPTFDLPAMDAVTSTFPYKNVMSFMIGPIKVYPKLHTAAISENKEVALAIERYGPIKEITQIEFFLPTSITKGEFDHLAAR